MRSPFLKPLALAAVCVLCGCRSPQPAAVPSANTATPASSSKSVNPAIRNNSIALLHDLLGDEKNVSKVLIIKRESPELNALIKNISTTAGEGAAMLESLAKTDRGLLLSKIGLPPGERATRQAISKTKEHELLFSSGAEFEFQLLLTQAEALAYGAHLAKVAADNEPQPARTQQFTNLSGQLTQLHEQVLTMLRQPHNHAEAASETKKN